ncbi:D-2-hydroxyacid dehydrogenase [Novosphingobium sp. 1949]|uniref:D-2-hydroxyacid dehydrogenase n=1 Tax=Novosphingobium organovorum TaxID=2930092 RepID=A0ABT0B7Y5_9SPHN|nr:D-2-hydroxyacid dehydrogenase [Novosphingobium organovorum]MCJ2181180.1 D-2-hydroxyacid dehydrogenase [Novosphingobium organovorum]
MTRALLHSRFRPFLEPSMPAAVTPVWYDNAEGFREGMDGAEIIWPDFTIKNSVKAAVGEAMQRANALTWCSVMSSGVDWLPLEQFKAHGVRLTNGAGLHAHSVAEFAVLGMLSLGKGWGTLLRAQDRHEWLAQPPGRGELLEAEVLVIGAGEIGQRIRTILEAFDARVTMARRTPRAGDLGNGEWRSALGRFDWVILIVPSTSETRGMFGAAELGAMKPGAGLVNVARGDVVDQDALIAALRSGQLGRAYLDVTDPEPLPADHALWSCPNVEISMHAAGLAQDSLIRRAAQRFAGNLERYVAGEPLVHEVDYARGY